MWEIIDLRGGGGGGDLSTRVGTGRQKAGIILEIGQCGSNGPPSVILRRTFFKKGGVLERGSPKKVFELIGTDCSMRKL